MCVRASSGNCSITYSLTRTQYTKCIVCVCVWQQQQPKQYRSSQSGGNSKRRQHHTHMHTNLMERQGEKNCVTLNRLLYSAIRVNVQSFEYNFPTYHSTYVMCALKESGLNPYPYPYPYVFSEYGPVVYIMRQWHKHRAHTHTHTSGISTHIYYMRHIIHTSTNLYNRNVLRTLYRNEERKIFMYIKYIKRFVNVTYGVSHHQPPLSLTPSPSHSIRFDLI